MGRSRRQKTKKRQTRRRKQRGGSNNNNDANIREAIRRSLENAAAAAAAENDGNVDVSDEFQQAANAANAAAGLPDMPQLCFGTVQINIEYTLPKALQLGYRHIDGADAYVSMHDPVPYLSILKNAIARSGIPRNQLWITWKSNDISIANIQQVIDSLDCGYIDLFLVHHSCGSDAGMRVFQEAQRRGLIRFFGVSNCENMETLRRLRETYGIYANQIQARPPGGSVAGRGPMAPDFIEQCNGLGIRVMLFGTMSGVTNLESQLIDRGNFAGFENLQARINPIKILINKYYIQRYLTPENSNVLMVGSSNPSSTTLQENLTAVTKALSPVAADRRLLTDEQMAQTETVLKSLSLSYQ
jgi:diketogulonate reductase-like aldo/keto reductase